MRYAFVLAVAFPCGPGAAENIRQCRRRPHRSAARQSRNHPGIHRPGIAQRCHHQHPTTDSEGKFALAGLDPGEYRLKATRTGYLPAYYGARRAGVRGALVRLAPAQEASDLAIRMFPFGVIAGTVRDEDGEPVIGADVRLWRWIYRAGGRQIAAAGFGTTDDLGQYRIASLAPGSYLVEARLSGEPRRLVDRSAGGPRPILLNVATFYPGVTEIDQARAVDLSPGSRANGVDVIMRRARAVRVSGSVTYAAGIVRRSDHVLLRTQGPSGYQPSYTAQAPVGAGNRFEFESVPPGRYRATISFGNQSELQVGQTDFLVTDEDVTGLRLRVEPGIVVTGRVTAEGDGNKLPSESSILLSGGPWNWGTRILEDGTFRIVMPPERYSLTFDPPAPGGWFLKSARVGDQDVLLRGLDLTASGPVTVDVVVSAESGNVDGVIVDADEKPVPAATVVLVPESALRVRFQSAATDQNGRYHFQAVAPGDYKIFAWEDVDFGSWFDPEFLKRYETSAQPVTVKAKETVVAQASRPATLTCRRRPEPAPFPDTLPESLPLLGAHVPGAGEPVPAKSAEENPAQRQQSERLPERDLRASRRAAAAASSTAASRPRRRSQ